MGQTDGLTVRKSRLLEQASQWQRRFMPDGLERLKV